MEPNDGPDYEVAIIGAGLGGICAAIKLRAMGVDRLVIVDRDEDFGGTWLRNTYPGVGSDIPAVAYQFTFAPKGDWKRFFADGDEVQQYVMDLVEQYELRQYAKFGTRVDREVFDEDTHSWRLHTGDGQVITSRFLISAIGAYINPRTTPDIPGLETFAGPIQIPSRWHHDVDLRGKRVGIIGVGSSTVQIAPSIAPEVEQLDIYQRTPQWYFPKPDFRVPRFLQRLLARRRFANAVNGFALGGIELGLRVLIYTPMPIFRVGAAIFDKVARWAYLGWLRYKVRDRAVRRQLKPHFGAGCTRGTLGADYLPTFNRPNVTLVSNGIERITPTGIVDRSGVERRIDVLVLATGYEMFSDPETYRLGAVVGANGFDLADFYHRHGLQAYQSASVPGLPNRFMLVGPYSWTGTSFHYILENSMRHIEAVIKLARAKRATWVEVTPQALERFQASIRHSGANLNRYFTVNCAGSNSYFINSQGDTPYVRPWTVLQSYQRSVRFPSDAYEFKRIDSPVKEIEHAI